MGVRVERGEGRVGGHGARGIVWDGSLGRRRGVVGVEGVPVDVDAVVESRGGGKVAVETIVDLEIL